MATELLRLPEVRQRTGLSRSEIYRRMHMTPPQFPPRVSLGGARAVAWISDDIDEWIADRIRHSRKTA